ncbi:hypothetical protein GWK47_031167 [Chionoecetes opilio]|uniref:Uncharacterized protein n=1 Tax=Chionoecetes opilio TaxID=41210 RepID=A0A8J4YJP1_CHIOP|nr:hypothetical protein GWK47_031167 [Chionoecetes opilio]
MAKESRKHERLAAERRRKEKGVSRDFGEGRDVWELVTGSSATAECADSSTFFVQTPTLLLGEAPLPLLLVRKELKITKEGWQQQLNGGKLTSRGAHHVFSAIAADQGVLSPSTSPFAESESVAEGDSRSSLSRIIETKYRSTTRFSPFHWDGKLLPGSESQGHVDRLAIVVTSPFLEGEKGSWLPLPCHPGLPEKQWPAKSRRPSDTGSF